MKILIVDNYDSFTYNIYQYAAATDVLVMVRRNNETGAASVRRMAPDKIILSPGPGTPSAAGRMMEIIDAMYAKVPMLGICLGHQAIAEFFGFAIVRSPRPAHGKTVKVVNDGKGIFRGFPKHLNAGLYNSLIAVPRPEASELIVSARTADGTVMGVRHTRFPVEGVQFHPDSILTPFGKSMLQKWVSAKNG